MPHNDASRHDQPTPASLPVLRPAQRSDLASLVALENAAFEGDRLSARQWARHLSSTSALVLVAMLGTGLAGAIVLFFRRGSDKARLYSLATDANMRGLGLGSRLLDAGERAARVRGCARIGLEVRCDNPIAQRLYERHGYRVTGKIPGYYEDGASALRYEKHLMDP
jgi:ribosomal protein S18 acetylase RimI-like enzyme